MSKEAKRDAVKMALEIADQVANGRLDPTELDSVVLSKCRELYGTVAGPGDPLWEIHVEVARQVLALDGIPVDELAEWLAAARRSERPVRDPESSWIARALADQSTGGADELEN
ncbi:MAG: flagellar hook-length control protein [Mycobacterium sp.]